MEPPRQPFNKALDTLMFALWEDLEMFRSIQAWEAQWEDANAVSYTHLTLPTIYSV